MLGRLARYLRFLGFDTEYVRGLSDDEVIDWARRDQRILLTRDGGLSRRFQPSYFVLSAELGRQLPELRRAFPGTVWAVRFDRCTLCNGVLRPWVPGTGPWPSDVPGPRADSELHVFECQSCSHRYWEGSHTARVRKDLAEWMAAEGPP
jgi:uncharacterized protein with PIN domain